MFDASPTHLCHVTPMRMCNFDYAVSQKALTINNNNNNNFTSLSVITKLIYSTFAVYKYRSHSYCPYVWSICKNIFIMDIEEANCVLINLWFKIELLCYDTQLPVSLKCFLPYKMCFIVLLLHAGSEGLTMCRRRIEGGKKKSSSAVAPIPNDLTGLRSLPSIWGNGFSLDRTGREPARLAVVEGDQKTRGVRGGRLRVLFSALLSPRPDSGLCGVGRQKRPFCSTPLILCVRMCGLRVNRQNQRAKQASARQGRRAVLR